MTCNSVTENKAATQALLHRKRLRVDPTFLPEHRRCVYNVLIEVIVPTETSGFKHTISWGAAHRNMPLSLHLLSRQPLPVCLKPFRIKQGSSYHHFKNFVSSTCAENFLGFLFFNTLHHSKISFAQSQISSPQLILQAALIKLEISIYLC